MAKGNAASTLSPFRFVAGSPVTVDDYTSALEESGHAASNTPEVLASGGAGLGWPSFYQCTFNAAQVGVWITCWRGSLRVHDDHKTVLFAVLSEFAAGEDGKVRVLIDGVERAIVAPSDADNDTWLTDTFSVATIGGAGEYDFEVQMQFATGVATDNNVRAWVLQTERVPLASTWPDPSG